MIAAHPDDEVLGCGATIAKHAIAGDRVHVLILGEGATSRTGASPGAVANLHDAALESGRVLGIESFRFAGFADNRLDTVAQLDVVKWIETELQRVEPHTVYTHHTGDLNLDHAIVGRCAQIACRPIASPVRRLLAFETLSSTEWNPADPFVPTWFSDVTSTLEIKLRALAAYVDELRAFPHPRSYEAVEHLARLRGSAAGVAAAEAFALIRWIG